MAVVIVDVDVVVAVAVAVIWQHIEFIDQLTHRLISFAAIPYSKFGSQRFRPMRKPEIGAHFRQPIADHQYDADDGDGPSHRPQIQEEDGQSDASGSHRFGFDQFAVVFGLRFRLFVFR